jgi:8-oxo-dGTP pyrophosphatase MutT (NUDIX family)
MNLPTDDLTGVERICFQVEEAQWYYEDFIRPMDPALPSMSLRRFCERIFLHCPLLQGFTGGRHMQAFEQFLDYKQRIPVRGAIMLNDAMDSAVLVKGWKKGANWSFPRGKINKDEDDLICAIREVYEETGYDLDAAGLIPKDRKVKYIEVNMREQQMRLYVFRNVPMDTHFEPRTRKEISKIQWWRLSKLPAFRRKAAQEQQDPAENANKFYMVAPFLVPLRKWVLEQKKLDSKRAASNQYLSAGDELYTEEDRGAESTGQEPSWANPPHGGIPDSDVLEEASDALRRLLHPQPPPQNSGEALLALLHSQPVASSHSIPQNAVPHTPLDHTIEQAPVPKTPHHHPPRPPHFSSMPSPPAFPIQQAPNTFFYQQPDLRNDQYHNNFQQTQFLSQQHPSRAQDNSHPYQSQHLIHPQPLPPHVQRAVFTGGPVHAPMVPPPIPQDMAPHPTHPVSVAMPNPQFPGLHSPMVPLEPKLPPPKLTSHSLALLNAFKSRDQAVSDGADDLPLRRYTQEPSPPQELPAEASHPAPEVLQPQLRAHQNTNGGPTPYSSRPHIGPPDRQQPMSRQQQEQRDKVASSGWANLPDRLAQEDILLSRQRELELARRRELQEKGLAPEIAQPIIKDTWRQININEDGTRSQVQASITTVHGESPPSMLPPIKPISEQHKSTLLGLFKSPATAAALPAKLSATALPLPSSTPSAVELSAVEPLSSTAASTSALLNNKRTPSLSHVTPDHLPKNGTIPRMNPELNLPFRAMAILSRPAELSDSERPVRNPPSPKTHSKTNGKKPASSMKSKDQVRQSPEKPLQPQILKRTQSSTSKQPESSTPTQSAFSNVSQPSTFDPRASNPVDHRQTLLSLFGKASGALNSLSKNPPSEAFTSSHPVDPQVVIAARSRVGSLASGEAATRKGSQAPISPADQGFLLSYLENVAKGAQR